MIIAIVLAAAAVVVIAVLAYETLFVRTSCHKINRSTGESFTVVQLSDLHGRTRFLNGSLSSMVNKLEPDLIMLTGDLASRKRDLPHVLAELRRITCREIYFVPGNYEREGLRGFGKSLYSQEEYESIMNALQEQGITVLENSGVVVDAGGEPVYIYGFDNSIYGNEAVTVEHAQWLAQAYVIVLAHSPSITGIIDREQLPYNLLLVGHTHGGQIRWFGRTTGAYKHCHVGLKMIGESRHFYINRGLGTVKIPVRWACPPEIAMFQIGKQA